jgi:type II secretory pathway pseudopilin PulG
VNLTPIVIRLALLVLGGGALIVFTAFVMRKRAKLREQEREDAALVRSYADEVKREAEKRKQEAAARAAQDQTNLANESDAELERRVNE